jgi:hypothetical protein
MGWLRHIIVVGAIATGVLAGPIASAQPAIPLEADTRVATAGFYQLRWGAGEVASRLVEATDPEFADARVIYAGPDTARLMSGKPDGDYYYRLEAAGATEAGRRVVLSNVLEVTVEHHPLERALAFFAVGATVFAATLGLILFGGRDERS